ncbi:hypothetical protein D3C71_1051100 [compost metagenome]
MLRKFWQLLSILYPQIPALPGFPVTVSGRKQRRVISAGENDSPLKIFRRQTVIPEIPDRSGQRQGGPALAPQHHAADQDNQQTECHTAGDGQRPEAQDEPQRQHRTQRR